MSNSQTLSGAEKVSRPGFFNNEPWAIWAAIVLVVASLVIAVLAMGIQGLVVVMVPAAIGMLALLCLVVFG